LANSQLQQYTCHDYKALAALADLICPSHELAGIERRTGREAPTVIT
jgi:hypothetical protein